MKELNLTTACSILGLEHLPEETELKKKYRELMHLVHPDSAEVSAYPFDAREINEAYRYLKLLMNEGSGEATQSAFHHWNAPVNKNAYAARPIYHEVEDEDGEILGRIEVDRGRYYWSKDESFPLFLLSLYTCSQELLNEVCDAASERLPFYQGELTFLLAKQFISQRKALENLVPKEERPEGEIYLVPAMLELNESGRRSFPHRRTSGEKIRFYPARLKRHRLYLKDAKGAEAGYLSFEDDRLYYIIIALFEERRVQVRITSEGTVKRTRRGKAYMELLLEMRFLKEETSHPENLNPQIRALLEDAGKNCGQSDDRNQ